MIAGRRSSSGRRPARARHSSSRQPPRLKLTPEDLFAEISPKLTEANINLYDALEQSAKKGEKLFTDLGINEKTAEALVKVAKEKIVVKGVTVQGILEVTAMGSKGVDGDQGPLPQPHRPRRGDRIQRKHLHPRLTKVPRRSHRRGLQEGGVRARPRSQERREGVVKPRRHHLLQTGVIPHGLAPKKMREMRLLHTQGGRCPRCGGAVKSPHPAKFSMDDRYRKYRLIMRRMSQAEEKTE